MDWLTCIKDAVEYMEDHLTDIRSPEEVAAHVNMSCMYLQRGFQILTGYTLGEYIRNRKLYLAAVDLNDPDVPVIDIAMKYGYETQASFDRAFSRFHGVSPVDVKRKKGSIRSFRRFSIHVSVQGGENMQFRIEKKKDIFLVGFQRVFDSDDSYTTIPEFWDEMTGKYASNLMKGEAPADEVEKYIASHHIGEFGVCIDELPGNKFNYMIAGYYQEDNIPEIMTARKIDEGDWAVFDCTLETLQDTNTAIWNEWLPGNSEYEISGRYNIEWYSPEGEPGPGQKCQIWMPVKRK